MRIATTAAIGIAALLSSAASAADEQAKRRLQHELTAGIPAAGIHALHDIRQALAEDLPAGLPPRLRIDPSRADVDARKPTDKI